MSEDRKYSLMRKAFYKKYVNKFVPLCKEKFETERKIRLFWAVIVGVLGILLLVGFLILLFAQVQNAESNNRSIFEGSVGIIALTTTIIIWIKKSFEKKIKRLVMPQFCRCFGEFYWHHGCSNKNFTDALLNNIDPLSDFDSTDYEGLFYKVGLFSSYNTEAYDDMFQGTFDGVKMLVSECTLSDVHGSGKNRTSVTIFKGAIVQLDMNKRFKSHTVIKPNSLFHLSAPQGLHHTVLEDVVFEKKFDVYTNDEVEARVLISPAFMERLNNLKTAFKVKNISCAFYKDKIFIALHTNKDLFSIGSLLSPVHKGRQWVEMFEEFLSVIKLIEYFKLNDRLML